MARIERLVLPLPFTWTLGRGGPGDVGEKIGVSYFRRLLNLEDSMAGIISIWRGNIPEIFKRSSLDLEEL